MSSPPIDPLIDPVMNEMGSFNYQWSPLIPVYETKKERWTRPSGWPAPAPPPTSPASVTPSSTSPSFISHHASSPIHLLSQFHAVPCQVASVRLLVDRDTDVVLSKSDANNGGAFTVPKSGAESIFPPLNKDVMPRMQTIVVRDLDGKRWEFTHVYRGEPLRHLLRAMNYVKEEHQFDCLAYIRKITTRNAFFRDPTSCFLKCIMPGWNMPWNTPSVMPKHLAPANVHPQVQMKWRVSSQMFSK
ncbi:Auxin response factor 8 [Acorus calamus]|uniref:Auxin response factor 8 n=1 Tax=Acorus calamus TaxID=4465 RepID=A0AAV9EH09_ACOCL|nr:Auxin response factor 8 [Acorus calamus]